jgi:hypothetical protein
MYHGCDYDEPDHFDRDPVTKMYCPECQVNVRPVRRDFGIGGYEYWGCKGFHTDWRNVCPECETECQAERTEDEESDA